MATRKRRVRLPKSNTKTKSPSRTLDTTAASRLVSAQRPRPKSTPAKKRTASALATKADTRVAQARQQAKQDLKQAKSLIKRIKRDFYELGLILARLKNSVRHRSLGYDSFHALVDAELDISRAHADNLATIATEVGRELAEKVGQSSALALVRLCRATPAADTPEQIATKKVKLPSGEILTVETATSRELRAAAAALRQKHASRQRGKTTSPEERAMAKEIQATFQALDIDNTRVRAVATKPGQEALLEIRVPFSSLSSLCQAICP